MMFDWRERASVVGKVLTTLQGSETAFLGLFVSYQFYH